MNSVEAILDKVDVIDAMSPYVQLTRVNDSNYKGLCPFPDHDDKNPSFFVNPEKGGMYHCFGCNESGNIITFLEKFQHKNFVEVMQELAQQVGVNFSTTGISKKFKEQQHLNKLMLQLQATFEFALTHKTKNKQLYEKILTKRKMTFAELKEFKIGFSDKDILNHFMEANGISIEERLKTGTYRVNSNGEIYSTLNHRITFALKRLNGDIVGFTGERTLSEDYQKAKYRIAVPKGLPKDYFYYIDNRINRDKPIYLCEGLYDVISLKLAGVKNAISTLGTNTTDEQIKSLLIHSNNFILCYDGDKPGLHAALQIYQQLKRLDKLNNVKIKMIQIPNNFDPDDYRKNKGMKAFQKLIFNPLSPIKFSIKLFLKKAKKEKLETADLVKGLLNITFQYAQDKIEQELYLNQLAKNFAIDKQALIQFQKKQEQKQLKAKSTQVKSQDNKAKPVQTKASFNIKDFIQTANNTTPDYKFDGVLYLREESVLSYLIQHPKAIYLILNNFDHIFYHKLAKALCLNLINMVYKYKATNLVQANLIKLVKKEHTIKEVLLEKIFKLNVSKEEFLTNLKLLNNNGEVDYQKELELKKLEKSNNIKDVINAYQNLKRG